MGKTDWILAAVFVLIVGGITFGLSRVVGYGMYGKTFGCIDERIPRSVQYYVSGINTQNYYVEYTDGTAKTFNRYVGETPVTGKPMCVEEGYK